MSSIVDKPYSTIAMNRGITSPQELMKMIKCGFTLNCDKNKCMCKNNGLFYTKLCNIELINSCK